MVSIASPSIYHGPQTYKTSLWLPKGKGGGSNQEIGINTYILLYMKYITNKNILYSTGKYTQYFIITNKEKESEEEYICMCVYKVYV